RQPRPLRALPVEGAEPVPFRSRFELLQAAALVERAEAQRVLFVNLLGKDEAQVRSTLSAFGQDPEAIGLERVLHAALAHAALDGEPRPQPLAEERFQALGACLFEGSPAAPGVR